MAKPQSCATCRFAKFARTAKGRIAGGKGVIVIGDCGYPMELPRMPISLTLMSLRITPDMGANCPTHSAAPRVPTGKLSPTALGVLTKMSEGGLLCESCWYSGSYFIKQNGVGSTVNSSTFYNIRDRKLVCLDESNVKVHGARWVYVLTDLGRATLPPRPSAAPQSRPAQGLAGDGDDGRGM